MTVIILIPARYASSRYPGKPLVQLKGKDGVSKPLIQRTWEVALKVPGVAGVFVATDDGRIAECVESFGGKVIMTGERCANGTERCAEALAMLDEKPDLIVNLQGDAPLTPPWFLKDLIRCLGERPDVGVATPILRCDKETYGHFRADRMEGRVGGTTAVFARDGRALYFSKEVIPYIPEGQDIEPLPVFHHVGVYAYRPEALERYASWQPGILEENEGLEQLRFLENGEKILCVEVEAKGQFFWELNNPVDVTRIEKVL
ncbi:MAG: 3-deoxy-manno-octulosonate cytidylyltransferase [Sphingomonadales bacterium]|nr:MAG: 3-deoxy-manno-octulosonate cytidylyltransferase [Sphingomonadales bacterium]